VLLEYSEASCLSSGSISHRLNDALGSLDKPSKQDLKGSEYIQGAFLCPRTKPKSIYRNPKISSTQQSKINNVWHAIKITRHAKNNEEKNQSTETNPKLTQILELEDEGIKTVIITNILKKVI